MRVATLAEYGIKTLLIFALMLLFLNLIQAQEMRDAVFLQNGSVIRGELVANDSGRVKVQTRDGSLWVFDTTEVTKVEREEVPKQKRTFTRSKRGFYNLSDAGVLYGQADNHTNLTLTAQTVCGFRMNEHIGVGLGIGLENYDVAPLAPVFADLRYEVLKGQFSPFIALQGGYGIPIDNYKNFEGQWVHQGGIMLNAGAGVRYYFTDHIALSLTAGYRHQRSSYRQNLWWIGEEGDAWIHEHYNRFVFRIGLLFS